MKYNDVEYDECSHVYPPAEDTFLLIDNLEVEEGSNVLEVGTGTGVVAITASLTAKSVTATDINDYALACARSNIKLNNRSNITVVKSDLFENIDDEYDLILFNTPYLPVSPEEAEFNDEYSKSWDGGVSGREVIDLFLMNASKYLKSHGKIQLVQSSLSDNDKTLKYLNTNGFNARITSSIHLFFEDIVVITAIIDD